MHTMSFFVIALVLRLVNSEPHPSPYDDYFYKVPEDIDCYSPGDVIRSRPLSSTILGQAVNSFQLFFATTNSDGSRSGTVATVWEPAQPAYPFKIFSYQFAEDSLQLNCVPSWAWANATSPQESSTSEGSLLAAWALSQGYYMVNTDNEGPDSAWLDGEVEGHSTLDGIRAAISYFNLRVTSTRVGLYGYSGGAHATAWASTLASSYAPELNLVGAAYGGTPIDVQINLDYLGGTPFSVLAILGLFGLANGNLTLNQTLTESLTPMGRNISIRVREHDFCAINGILAYPGYNVTSLLSKDFFMMSVVRGVFDRNSLLSNVSTEPVPVPKFPRLQVHGLRDELVPYGLAKQYVKEQCAKGADIRFVSLNSTHAGTSLLGLPAAVRFLEYALEGTLPSAVCGANVSIPAIGSTEAIEALGANTNLALASQFAMVGSF